MIDRDKTQLYNHEVDLEFITGLPIVRIVGYDTNESGDPAFKLTRVITQAGESYHVEGEHDLPYVDEAKLRECK